MKKVTGQVWHLRIESVSGAGVSPPPGTNGKDAESPISPSRRQRQEAMQLPLVKRVMEVMGAQILDVDEGFGSAQGDPTDVPEAEPGEE